MRLRFKIRLISSKYLGRVRLALRSRRLLSANGNQAGQGTRHNGPMKFQDTGVVINLTGNLIGNDADFDIELVSSFLDLI